MAEAENSQNAAQICPRCHHQRAAQEIVPDWQCPNCQIAYHKYIPPAEPSLDNQQAPTNGAIRPELYPQTKGSPLPWLLLILLCFALLGYLGYDYFSWPEPDKITLYTSDSCGPACDQARDWLIAKTVPFQEKNIDRLEEHRTDWKQVGGDRVPMAYFGVERIAGFNKTIYQIALTGFQDRTRGKLNQSVILFTAEHCENCQAAVELLNRKKIAFEEYDIREAENISVFKELFGSELPLMFVGNIRLDGYEKKTLEFALRQVELP